MRLESHLRLVEVAQRFKKVEIGLTEPMNQGTIHILQQICHQSRICGGVEGNKKPERVAFNVITMLKKSCCKAFGVVAGSIKGEPLITDGTAFGIGVLQIRLEGATRGGVEQNRGNKCQYQGQTSHNRPIASPRISAPS
ncbi:MAG: hypothetical protein ACKVIY_08085 [Acidimicrobiales bacterium]